MGGCTSAWVAAFVASNEWHHCDRATGDGRPVDFYDLAFARDLWAAWLERDDQALAATHIDNGYCDFSSPSVREIEAWFAARKAAEKAAKVDARIGHRGELTIRDYERKRGVWRLVSETIYGGIIRRITPSGLMELACDDGVSRRGKTWRVVNATPAAV